MTYDEIFGRLSLDALPFTAFIKDPSVNEGVANAAASLVVIGAAAVLFLLTKYRLWGPLWRDWLTSTDHKKIGIMYIVFALVMLTRGVIEGVVMRTQQAFGLDGGFLQPDHFAQLFSTHGTIMIFFMAMPFMTGLINIIMPLQIGTRDVAYPLLNSISFWLTASGAGLVLISLVIGKFSTAGWTGYPPYSGVEFTPGVGVDYWIWAVLISGVGTTMSGINFVVTIIISWTNSRSISNYESITVT